MTDKQIIPKTKVKVPLLKLEMMFDQQIKFQKRFYNFKKMTEKERSEYIQLMLTCINVEMVEALNWINWKPWKKTKQKWNRYEFINEMVDIQHFLINVLLSVDCSPSEFTELFLNKGKENINRQKKGY